MRPPASRHSHLLVAAGGDKLRPYIEERREPAVVPRAVGAAVCGGRTRRMSRPSAAVASDDARNAAARLPS